MRPADRSGSAAVPSLAGSLLLAHPSMPDTNFRRTVILLPVHSQDGSLGVIINRPLGTKLGQLKPDLEEGPLAEVPVYDGGPVNRGQLILAAWQVIPDEGAFRLFFGLEPARLAALTAQHPGLSLRAFFGYSGWSGGQLEGELRRDDWIVQAVNPGLIADFEGEVLWRRCVGAVSPDLRLLADAPDEPGSN